MLCSKKPFAQCLQFTAEWISDGHMIACVGKKHTHATATHKDVLWHAVRAIHTHKILQRKHSLNPVPFIIIPCAPSKNPPCKRHIQTSTPAIRPLPLCIIYAFH